MRNSPRVLKSSMTTDVRRKSQLQSNHRYRNWAPLPPSFKLILHIWQVATRRCDGDWTMPKGTIGIKIKTIEIQETEKYTRWPESVAAGWMSVPRTWLNEEGEALQSPDWPDSRTTGLIFLGKGITGLGLTPLSWDSQRTLETGFTFSCIGSLYRLHCQGTAEFS